MGSEAKPGMKDAYFPFYAMAPKEVPSETCWLYPPPNFQATFARIKRMYNGGYYNKFF